MKVFMLGWEFPPFISGGLGTACYGLTKAMSRLGMEITFVLPRVGVTDQVENIKILSTEGFIKSEDSANFKNVCFRAIDSHLKPYVQSQEFAQSRIEAEKNKTHSWVSNISNPMQNYSQDIYEQVHRYAEKAGQIASVEDFDIVHAHDWMTFPAGMTASKISRKPMVVHMHSTEFDRSGEHVNQVIYDIERRGMYEAQKVIAVSNYTKNIITSRYSVPAEKIEVVYNGVENNNNVRLNSLPRKSQHIVLFLGRVTFQKGPDYFIAAAKRVLEKIDNVKFIMAGDGDMLHRMIEYAASLGIGHKIFFTRFLRGADVQKVFRMADLYVMPSVSEPFGISSLEALKNNVPILISRQSGIAEAINNALKVDFWDVDKMADKIIAVLKHRPLRQTLMENACPEVEKFCWRISASKINTIYNRVLACA